jgi:hypothetical protein
MISRRLIYLVALASIFGCRATSDIERLGGNVQLRRLWIALTALWFIGSFPLATSARVQVATAARSPLPEGHGKPVAELTIGIIPGVETLVRAAGQSAPDHR